MKRYIFSRCPPPQLCHWSVSLISQTSHPSTDLTVQKVCEARGGSLNKNPLPHIVFNSDEDFLERSDNILERCALRLQVVRPTSNQPFLHILPLLGKLSKNEHMLNTSLYYSNRVRGGRELYRLAITKQVLTSYYTFPTGKQMAKTKPALAIVLRLGWCL